MRGTRSEPTIAIIGGGPGGAVAALCLRKLGRPAVVFEREEFPRYRIGESLLPGTLSILSRLGLHDELEAANFPIKRAATFLWGKGEQADLISITGRTGRKREFVQWGCGLTGGGGFG